MYIQELAELGRDVINPIQGETLINDIIGAGVLNDIFSIKPNKSASPDSLNVYF